MKSIEELKEEQYDLKAKLHEIVEFMNSEEYFTLNESRKKMYNNLKVGIEMHLKCLSIMIYEDLDSPVTTVPDFGWLGLMMGTFMSSSFNMPTMSPELKESDFETKQEDNEE
jgi:hypothetical protein